MERAENSHFFSGRRRRREVFLEQLLSQRQDDCSIFNAVNHQRWRCGERGTDFYFNHPMPSLRLKFHPVATVSPPPPRAASMLIGVAKRADPRLSQRESKPHQAVFHLGQRQRAEKEELPLHTQADIKHCKELLDKSCNQSPLGSDGSYSLQSLLTRRDH